MADYMTMQDIKSHFPSEWVLLGNPQKDEQNRVVGGLVLCHSKDRDVVYGHRMDAKSKHIAFLYTGPIPAPGTAILL
jgi:hypothetical protein